MSEKRMMFLPVLCKVRARTGRDDTLQSLFICLYCVRTVGLPLLSSLAPPYTTSATRSFLFISFSSTGVVLRNGRELADGSIAVFDRLSRVNHSCAPNCIQVLHDRTGPSMNHFRHE